MVRLQKTIFAAVLLSIAFACERGDQVQTLRPLDDAPVLMDLPVDPDGRRSNNTKYAVLSAQYVTSAESGQIGRTVFFKDVGNKQLDDDFVPGMSLDGSNDISFYIDGNRPSDDLGVGESSAAIARAMRTWDGVTCSQPGMFQIPSQRRTSTGYVAQLFGFRGSFDYVADVVHAGWLPGKFFALLAEDGSASILGVTFTIIFTEDDGTATDVDNNGKLDVAWREIYYNDAFAWADGATYDIETVALHEAGHGLSQGHFGQAFLDGGSGQLHFSPLAVMNAAYSGIQTRIGSSDNAGHCSIWSTWSGQ